MAVKQLGRGRDVITCRVQVQTKKENKKVSRPLAGQTERGMREAVIILWFLPCLSWAFSPPKVLGMPAQRLARSLCSYGHKPIHGSLDTQFTARSLSSKFGRSRGELIQTAAHPAFYPSAIYEAFEFIGNRLPTAFFKELGMIDNHPVLLAIYFLSNLAFPAAGIRMLMVRERPNRRLGWLVILVGFISAAFHWWAPPPAEARRPFPQRR